MACKLLKLMFAPLDPQFGFAQHVAHKGIARPGLVGQLLGCPDHRVHFAPQQLVQRVQRLHHGDKIDAAHQQHIHIAVLGGRQEGRYPRAQAGAG